ncbi:MAG: HAMP domain-containing histidine kinase [Alphaproteobacteria bacterium]|nr:HAMP domain-containing histidine kinase [Alphaproteobacteria bacterium]
MTADDATPPPAPAGAAAGFGLDAAALHRLFPFHLVLDRALQVRQAGPVLRRILPALASQADFSDHFTIRRPALALDFDSLVSAASTIFMVEARARPELVLKGQIVPGDSSTLVFVGSPWVTDLQTLPRLGLTIADFAIHDSIADFLVHIQAQKAALEDTGQLARQLAEARDTALKASRIKSEFLANMSHELRTPLNAIIGFSEMLSTETLGPLPARYQTYAQYIRSSGVMLLDLINDLLDLSRIEAGPYELEESDVELAPALAECLAIVTAAAQQKGLKLSLDPGPAGLAVHVDLRAFKQVVLNLLSNAVKFTDSGGVALTATLDAGALALTVTDTGIGIAPEILPRLFEPFRQGHAGISRKYGGSGLGLSICRNLVELHGGSIDLTSKPDSGTTVTVRLPPNRVIQRR